MFENLVASIYERSAKDTPKPTPSSNQPGSKIKLDEDAGKKKGGCC